MKRTIFLFSLSLLVMTSCSDYIKETVTYKVNEPVFMSNETFRNSVKVSTVPQTISGIGKMCFYNNYLYISEPNKGIHIINNTDPANPQVTGFIQILGNADLAIRNGLLYADSFIDLVWFDVTNPAYPELKGRLDSIFPTALPLPPNHYGIDYAKTYSVKNNGIVIGWELKEKTEEISRYTGGWLGGNESFDKSYQNSATSTSTTTSSTGINGSMSRFTIYNDHLYSVINNYLNIFNLSGNLPAKSGSAFYIGRNVETIFSYKNNMFMGTPTGMLIYSVSDPVKPVWQSTVNNIYGCDPVVVENDIAYVTVRSGNGCGQGTNELFAVNVSDVKNPKQIVSYAMSSPKGLAVDNDKLFVCDDGLKIYKITDPQTIMLTKLGSYTGMNGFDLILQNKYLMMIADDGLYQYDYSDLNNIKQISKIPIGK